MESGDGVLEGLHFFAEGESDEVSAVLFVFVEGGGGDGGYADFGGEVFAEIDVVCESEGSVVGEYEVGACGFVWDFESDLSECVAEEVAAFGVFGGELGEVVVDTVHGYGGALLERGRGGKGDELVGGAEGLDKVFGSDRPADFPAG